MPRVASLDWSPCPQHTGMGTSLLFVRVLYRKRRDVVQEVAGWGTPLIVGVETIASPPRTLILNARWSHNPVCLLIETLFFILILEDFSSVLVKIFSLPCWQWWLKNWRHYSIGRRMIPLADWGGRSGRPPPWPNYNFYFHAVFGRKWSNNRLVLFLEIGSPSRLENNGPTNMRKRYLRFTSGVI